eukprot:GHVR01041831.1.p1 GENE.GHVR01041831.1~~GHVR01041831.1.p1  ORF type:complete len:138 (+),score=40.01 GHVR01041831.1:390-803(+)
MPEIIEEHEEKQEEVAEEKEEKQQSTDNQLMHGNEGMSCQWTFIKKKKQSIEENEKNKNKSYIVENCGSPCDFSYNESDDDDDDDDEFTVPTNGCVLTPAESPFGLCLKAQDMSNLGMGPTNSSAPYVITLVPVQSP